jgi:malonate decarboxylase beta subunit
MQAQSKEAMNTEQLLQRDSFIELNARSRAGALLDAGSMRELIGPFDRVTSPWLAQQGVITQSDDGVVVAKGTCDGQPAVILAIEGAFQGGSLGEVGGAKIAGALELAAQDNRNGVPTRAIILFETGGVRLQEANLGLAAIAEIHSAIVDLRRYQPVIGIIAGTVGCFGGMSIAAALCSYLIVTREARLGLNGPAVIEQEAGIAEYDSRDKPFIWSFTGGEQRYRCGLADAYVEDDAAQIRSVVRDLLQRGLPRQHRSDMAQGFLERLAEVDASVQATPELVRAIYQKGFAS